MQILKNWEFAFMFFVHVKCVPECHVRCYLVYGKIVHMYVCTEYFYVKEVLINVHTTYIFKIFFLLLFTFYKVLQNSLPICKQLMLYIKLFFLRYKYFIQILTKKQIQFFKHVW